MKVSLKTQSLIESFKDFCQSTSVHGYKHVVGNLDTPLIEKIIWFFVNLGILIISLYIMIISLVKINENPTAVTLDNQSYDVRNLYFPAVAVCNINQMSRAKTYEYAEFLAQQKFGMRVKQTDIDWYFTNLKYMGQLLVYNTDATPNMIDFQNDLDNLDPNPVTGFWDTEKAMKFMAPTCEEHIFNVKYNGENYNTSDIFLLHKADEGYCCIFNYLRPPYTKYNDTYNTDNRTFWVKVGVSNGLEFLVVNNLSDYYYPTMSVIGFQILTFNPFEYPEAITGNYRRDILEMGETSYFEVQTTVHRASRDITRYSRRKRGCMFREEDFKHFEGNYKFAECLLKCRMASFKALCECLPYFVPMNFKDVATNDTVICNLSHLTCLFKYRLKFHSWSPLLTEDDVVGLEREFIDGITCNECYPDCAYTRYSLLSAFVPLTKLPRTYRNLNNVTDHRNSNIVKVYFNKQYTALYYTDLVYSWEEMLSVFGSLLSVIFGFSIISLLEIFYFGLWRTFQHYRGHLNEEEEEEIVNVDITNYKSVEQAFLKISMRKNLFPLPSQYEFLREIQPRKPIRRLVEVQMHENR